MDNKLKFEISTPVKFNSWDLWKRLKKGFPSQGFASRAGAFKSEFVFKEDYLGSDWDG